jgi:hypothetical protein
MGCAGDDLPAGLAAGYGEDEVPRSSREHWDRQLAELEQRLERLDEGAAISAKPGREELTARHAELVRRAGELNEMEGADPLREQSRLREAFELDLLQLATDVELAEDAGRAPTGL